MYVNRYIGTYYFDIYKIKIKGITNHLLVAALIILCFYKYRLLGSFPNTYTLTKLIAEQIINEERHNIPVVIFRPSIGELSLLY